MTGPDRKRDGTAASPTIRESQVTQARIPAFHLTAPAGALNDPNGLWADAVGRVHVAYQHNPAGESCLSTGAGSGPKHWGHAWSDDMITWTYGPSVISPTPGWHDCDGAWSGSIVADRKHLYAFYTGVRRRGSGWAESVCSALIDGDAGGIGGMASENKRLLIPAGAAGVGNQFRDPHVTVTDGTALMIVGGDTAEGGRIMSYRSTDLVLWESCGVFFDASSARTILPPDLTDAAWECPQLLRLGDTAVLIISIDRNPRPVVYLVGSADIETGFHAEIWGYVDPAFGSYATYVAPLGNESPCSISWICGPSLSQRRSNDRGHLTMVRRLELRADRHLTARFIRSPHEVADAADMQLRRFCGGFRCSGPTAALVEAALTTEHSDAGLARFRVGTPAEALELDVDSASQQILLRTPVHMTRLEVRSAEIELHVIWDAPIVEIIIDGHSLTHHFMPSDDDVTLSLQLSRGAQAAGTIAVDPDRPSRSP